MGSEYQVAGLTHPWMGTFVMVPPAPPAQHVYKLNDRYQKPLLEVDPFHPFFYWHSCGKSSFSLFQAVYTYKLSQRVLPESSCWFGLCMEFYVLLIYSNCDENTDLCPVGMMQRKQKISGLVTVGGMRIGNQQLQGTNESGFTLSFSATALKMF